MLASNLTTRTLRFTPRSTHIKVATVGLYSVYHTEHPFEPRLCYMLYTRFGTPFAVKETQGEAEEYARRLMCVGDTPCPF